MSLRADDCENRKPCGVSTYVSSQTPIRLRSARRSRAVDSHRYEAMAERRAPKLSVRRAAWSVRHNETMTRLVPVLLAASAFTSAARAHSLGTDTNLCPFPVTVELLRSGSPHAETAVLDFTLEGPI